MSKSNTLALGIISLIFGIIGVLWWRDWCIAPVVAIILGLMAMKGSGTGKVLGTVGFVLGIIGAILWTLELLHIFALHLF